MTVGRSWTSLVVAFAILLLSPGIAIAQEATPGPFPVAPDPSECRVAPRGPVIVLTSEGTPEPWPTVGSEVDLPVGQPASVTDIADVTAVEREIIACGNAADLPRAYALVTEDSAKQMVMAGAVGLLGSVDFSSPIMLLDVRDVRVLPDGRLGAIVVWQLPILDTTEIETLIHAYEHVDGQWRIDEEITVGDVLVIPVAATPVP